MSRLTRDGTAEPVSRDQILRHARGQGNVHFPCSADHEQDWQPYPVDPYSAICDDHTYIHTLPKGTKLELGKGAHLKTPSSANHTAAASQPTGRIAKAASWLHLSRVSPALHPPERPSHTHTPKPGFGGRGGIQWTSVQYNGGFLPDIILLTRCYYYRGTRLNVMLFVVSHIQRIGCQPEKNYYTVANPARGLLNKEKRRGFVFSAIDPTYQVNVLTLHFSSLTGGCSEGLGAF